MHHPASQPSSCFLHSTHAMFAPFFRTESKMELRKGDAWSAGDDVNKLLAALRSWMEMVEITTRGSALRGREGHSFTLQAFHTLPPDTLKRTTRMTNAPIHQLGLKDRKHISRFSLFQFWSRNKMGKQNICLGGNKSQLYVLILCQISSLPGKSFSGF